MNPSERYTYPPVQQINRVMETQAAVDDAMRGVLGYMGQYNYSFESSASTEGEPISDDKPAPEYMGARELVAFIGNIRNGKDIDRDRYVKVMHAISATMHGIDHNRGLSLTEKEQIGAAAVAWACKWSGADSEEEQAKWTADFSRYPAGGFKTGWSRLVRLAQDFGYTDAAHDAAALQYIAEPAPLGTPVRTDKATYEDVPEFPGGAIEYFNRRYFVVNESGKAMIYRRIHDTMMNRRYYERLNFTDSTNLHSNKYVKITSAKGEEVREKAARMWLSSSYRREYLGGIVFDPSGKHVPADALNLWDGFAVQAVEGSWDRLKAHIHDVICSGVEERYEYLMNWMARLVQRPGEQGEVAVVLRSVEGTGKGVLARAIKHILGQHGLAISDAKHLVGNFNGHLRDCVFLFADEAFFAGDRAYTGVLKSIITEPYLTVEGKIPERGAVAQLPASDDGQ